jgi:hypothetical protein
MADHTRYFSGKYPDEKKESPFQLTYYTYHQYIEYISEDEVDLEYNKESFHREDHSPYRSCDTDFNYLIETIEPPSKITEFLEYHFEKYEGTKIDFVDHIKILMDDNSRFHYEKIDKEKFIIDPEIVTIKVSKDRDVQLMKLRDPLKVLRRDKVYEWIEDKKEELKAENKKLQTIQKKGQQKQPHLPPLDEFSEWFKSKEHYDYIIKLLIDKDYLSRSTGEWRDDKKDKAFAISILKYLKGQGYFRPELKPTAEDYRRITNNVWGMDVKPSTARQAKISEANLKFILPVNQIPL